MRKAAPHREGSVRGGFVNHGVLGRNTTTLDGRGDRTLSGVLAGVGLLGGLVHADVRHGARIRLELLLRGLILQ